MRRYKPIIWAVFILYILIILKLTIFRADVNYAERQLNLSLFTDLIYIYKHAGIRLFLRFFLGNIGWFVPFGFFTPLLSQKENPLKTIIPGMIFSLLIETSQFIFRKGVAELDDIILNTLGVAIGYFSYRYIAKPLLARFLPDDR